MYGLQFSLARFAGGTVDRRSVVKFGPDVWPIDFKHDLAVCTPFHFWYF